MKIPKELFSKSSFGGDLKGQRPLTLPQPFGIVILRHPVRDLCSAQRRAADGDDRPAVGHVRIDFHAFQILLHARIVKRQLNPAVKTVRKALEQLPKLNGCQVHSTVMLSEVDRKIFKKLGVGLTCDPVKKD